MGFARDGFLAIDWGTTNRRVYALDRAGAVETVEEAGAGVLSPPVDGFAAEVARIRAAHGGRPTLLAGMVGSNRGWVDVAYADLPAGLGELAAGLRHVSDGVAIVPGLAQRGSRPDVMRGEEVQILGAHAAGWIGADAVVCHPGTHAKWIELCGGRITAFRTAMTGELFALLRDHSILAPQLAGAVAADAAFARGVDDALAGASLASALFGVRARFVLDGAGDGASYASGLLIGADVAAADGAGEVVVMGRSDLCTLYAAALARAGRPSRAIDGADAFVAGMCALAAA